MSANETPNERTSLIQTDNTRSRVPNIYDEFQDALSDEASNKEDSSFFSLLVKRPVAVISALSLFALFLITLTSLKSLNTSDLVDRVARVPIIEPMSVNLLQITDDAIDIKADFMLTLNYGQLGENSTLYSVSQYLGSKFGSIDISFDGPVSIYAEQEIDDEENNEFKTKETRTRWAYVISASVKESLNVDIQPGLKQEASMTVSVTEPGRSDALGQLVSGALLNKPIPFKAKGTAIVSKFGLHFRVPFTYYEKATIPKEATDELAEVSQVAMGVDRRGAINITGLANASVGEFPVAAEIPPLNWKVKIPGCESTKKPQGKIENVCEAMNLPISVNSGDREIDLFFYSAIKQIPDELTKACPHNPLFKSPLDSFIAKYLAGGLTTIYMECLPHPGQPTILNELLSGYDIPFSMLGKPATEKLIKNVSLEEVRFDNQYGLPGRHKYKRLGQPLVPGENFGEGTRMTFSGRALLEAVPPQFLDIQYKNAIQITGARGTVQLFDKDHVHFGQVRSSEAREDDGDDNDGSDDDSDGDYEDDKHRNAWLQTISMANNDGYKVTCFFDNVPMEVTNSNVLAKVSNEVLWKGHSEINYDAVVDVRFETIIGKFLIRQFRIKGTTQMYA